MRLGLCRAALLKAFVSTSFVDSNLQDIEMSVLKIFSEGLSLVRKIFIWHQIILSSFKERKKGGKCCKGRIKKGDSKRDKGRAEKWKGEGEEKRKIILFRVS